MVDKLKELIENEQWEEARNIAEKSLIEGEDTDTFWILCATVYEVYGEKELEYMCISRGIYVNPENYELYFMLGNYYSSSNVNKAYLCYRKALSYCNVDEDRICINETIDYLKSSEKIDVNGVSFVIPTTDMKELLEECIISIRNTFTESNYEIIVVDNASSDETALWLSKQSGIKVIHSNEFVSLSKSYNEGIRNSNAKYDIMVMNNDTVLTNNAVFWMLMGLYERKTVGAVGPLSNCAGKQTVNKEFANDEECLEYSRNISFPSVNSYENKISLSGVAMLIKREVIDKDLLFDEKLAGIGFEDEDYGIRLSEAGFELLLCYNSFVIHRGGATVSKKLDYYKTFAKNNLNILNEKFGHNIGYYSFIRNDLIGYINEPLDKKINVLEIGCGCGATLSHIRKLYSNSNVYGIELVEDVANLGKFMANIITGNFEEMDELPYEEESLDYVICGDVLEHLRDPYGAMKKIRKYMKKDGKIITSIPNLMNMSIIVNLLKGYFTYREAGLLDKTHIHLFTKSEIVKMFLECGYRITDLAGRNYYETDLSDSTELVDAIYNLPGIADRTEFEVYQYITVAQKHEEDVENG